MQIQKVKNPSYTYTSGLWKSSRREEVEEEEEEEEGEDLYFNTIIVKADNLWGRVYKACG